MAEIPDMGQLSSDYWLGGIFIFYDKIQKYVHGGCRMQTGRHENKEMFFLCGPRFQPVNSGKLKKKLGSQQVKCLAWNNNVLLKQKITDNLLDDKGTTP